MFRVLGCFVFGVRVFCHGSDTTEFMGVLRHLHISSKAYGNALGISTIVTTSSGIISTNHNYATTFYESQPNLATIFLGIHRSLGAMDMEN